MAPKKIGIPVLTRIPEQDLAEIDARCEETGLNRSETIRRMIRWALKDTQPQKKSGTEQ